MGDSEQVNDISVSCEHLCSSSL